MLSGMDHTKVPGPTYLINLVWTGHYKPDYQIGWLLGWNLTAPYDNA